MKDLIPSLVLTLAGRLLVEDFDRARRNADMKREILYKGVKSELVKVNRRA